ncbi:MAG: hypothetical protein PHY16_12770 [Methylobacter sp.]|nr:hypothetical protein [Methylobacter sp.]
MSFSRNASNKCKALAISIPLVIAPFPIFASTFNAAADFSSSNDPNSVWSYGWSETLGSTLNLYSTPVSLGGVDGWYDPAHNTQYAPLVAHNGTANVLEPIQNIIFQPGQLGVHPGLNNEYSVIRWTAPDTGAYSVTASFIGIESATTDVHVLNNGNSLFQGAIDGLGDTALFSPSTISVNAGDTIDLAVGYGSNGNLFSDTTGVSATISSVPIPAAMWLFSSALAGIFFCSKRKLKAFDMLKQEVM